MFKHYDKSDHKTKELYDAIKALNSRISFLESKLSDSEKENTDLWRQVNKPVTSYGAIKLDSITLDLILSTVLPDGGGNIYRAYVAEYFPKPEDYGLNGLSGYFFCSTEFINVPENLGACIFSGNYQEGTANVIFQSLFNEHGRQHLYINASTYNLELSQPKVRLDFSYIPYK